MTKKISALVAAVIVALFTMVHTPAYAQSLDELRSSGAVGERYDGLLVQRSGGSNVAAVVKSVNAKRRAIYQQRAATSGATATQVGQVYANQIRQSAPGGTWFQDKSGRWSR